MEPKVALITGCNSGIGLATAAALARDSDRKYIVYATMRTLGKRGDLEKAADNALNDTLFIRELNVTNADTIVKVVGEIKETHGRIDILINNAGIGHMMIMEITELQEMRDIMEVNFFGTVRMIQEVLPMMKQRQSGRIINISSIAGIFGYPHGEAYTASKHAIEGVTESLAIQLRQHGIWVSSIQPGPIKTAINDKVEYHEELIENEKLDPKTKALFQATTTQMRHILTSMAYPVEKAVDAIRHAMEDEKPHIRYRCSGFFPFENLKFLDEHGDDYVDAAIALFATAPST